MSLSKPERLLSKLEELEGLRSDQRSGTRRRFARHVARGEAAVCELHVPCSGTGTIMVAVRDLALGGVGFVTNVRFDPESLWRMNFLLHHHPVASAVITVRHCRSVEDELFLVGAQVLLDPGIMLTMGVDHSAIGMSLSSAESSDFLPPSEIH